MEKSKYRYGLGDLLVLIFAILVIATAIFGTIALQKYNTAKVEFHEALFDLKIQIKLEGYDFCGEHEMSWRGSGDFTGQCLFIEGDTATTRDVIYYGDNWMFLEERH